MRCLRGSSTEFFERVHGLVTLGCPASSSRSLAARHGIHLAGPPLPVVRWSNRSTATGSRGRSDYAVRRRGGRVGRSRGRVEQRSLFAICGPVRGRGPHCGSRNRAARGPQVRGSCRSDDGRRASTTSCSAPFGDRLFAFEHRNWEAVDPRPAEARGARGSVLALECWWRVEGARDPRPRRGAGRRGGAVPPGGGPRGVVNWMRGRSRRRRSRPTAS